MLGVGSWGWADPSTGQLWPVVDPSTGSVRGSGWVSARAVAAIPSVGRALGIITGRFAQMPLRLRKFGQFVDPAPRLLTQPDPSIDYPTWIGAAAWDYHMHGNVIIYDTSYNEFGLPETAAWFSAEQCGVWEHPEKKTLHYTYRDQVLDTDRVHHIRRRLDPYYPYRGIGVLEQHMRTFAKISDQQSYESSLLQDSGVPSVVIVSGNPDLSQEEANEAKSSWMDKFSGPKREPVFLPAGSEVKPLAWSPRDAEMIEAQKLSRGDVADIFNLDRYYMGVADGSFNYKTTAGMSAALVKDTLGESIATFQAALTMAWCLPGAAIEFDPDHVIVDDIGETVTWLQQAVDAGILTTDEARARIGYQAMTDEQRQQAAEQRRTSTMKKETQDAHA